ncbi:helix-turn-helix domain-containing protein [Alkaliphilus oremlandii]|uniref:Transcriptional regulator, XRE family n=1 Tax=Alkaliphilus oremlandii (strain OhILAs) TaxID=350688 RepID=A8MHW1_ALKOO|nr:helix-turn-helix domain-containing protein [Alkaliphilus oremlandii]ABW19393.1 transcriptional regulator, XRE family [Alkaliphilus oremlandii OhILAs]
MTDKIKFKERLKELRKENNMTQQELADKLGLVRTAIANYETGRTVPDAETLNLIANILSTTTDYLLGRANYIPKEKNKPSSTDIISEDIRKLSPESQEELKKLIELYKMRDMQKRNDEISDELTK